MMLYFTLFATNFILTESIQYFESDRDTQVYNNQAFNLINLLTKVKSDDHSSFKAVSDRNKHLQNAHEDFKNYFNSKNSLFKNDTNLKSVLDSDSRNKDININHSGLPFNEQFPNIKGPVLSGDEVWPYFDDYFYRGRSKLSFTISRSVLGGTGFDLIIPRE